ncbi:MAG TPA: endonuclease VII domain-containing protein [Anaerolineae bacterium]|nr:endonuclease VII domain-containing protein [Anaerolineae bacterium]
MMPFDKKAYMDKYNREYYQRNRERALAYAATYREENVAMLQEKRESPRRKRQDQEAHLKRAYGLSLADYDAILADQGGGCAICGALPGDDAKGRLHVDHDHETGQVRGLLCGNCNHALGSFRDSIALMRSAIAYLESNECA